MVGGREGLARIATVNSPVSAGRIVNRLRWQAQFQAVPAVQRKWEKESIGVMVMYQGLKLEMEEKWCCSVQDGWCNSHGTCSKFGD